MSTIGRNEPCPCGSGKKYKKCCLPREEALVRKAPAPEPAEQPFIAEIRPEVDKAADRLLARLERGERQGLGAEFEALYQEHPDYHMTNYAMGVWVGIGEDDPVGAIPFFEKAVRVFPPLAEAHYNLGSSYLNDARIPEAVGAFRQAIRYSDGEDGIDALARERLRELEGMIRESSPFRTLDAYLENQKLFDQAFARLQAQDYAKAAELFEQMLEQNPDHVQSYGNLALAEAGLGHKAVALQCLDKALALDPTYEPARVNRKTIERMNEDEPQSLPMVEMEYYRERLEAEQKPARNWRQKLKFWKAS